MQCHLHEVQQCPSPISVRCLLPGGDEEQEVEGLHVTLFLLIAHFLLMAAASHSDICITMFLIFKSLKR